MDLFFGGLASLFILAALLPLGLIVLGLAVVFNGRREEDPQGLRPTAIYLGALCFLTLFVTLFAGTAAVGQLSSLLVPDDDRQVQWLTSVGGERGELMRLGDPGRGRFDCFPGTDDGFPPCRPDPDDIAVRDTVKAALLALPAAVLLWFHWRRRNRLVAGEGFAGTAAWRANRVFLYLVCLVAAAAGAFAVGAVLYDVFRVIAPDITADAFGRRSEREKAVADAITMTVLAAGSALIFFRHWSEASGESNPLRRLWPVDRTKAEPDKAPESEPEPAPD